MRRCNVCLLLEVIENVICRQQQVPWKSILTSKAAWSIGITTFGRIWVHYTFIISGPTYMKRILGFSIEKVNLDAWFLLKNYFQCIFQNGLLSGAPFICSYIASVFFCYIADKLVTGNYMSLTNVRKLMTALCKHFNWSYLSSQCSLCEFFSSPSGSRRFGPIG